MLAILVVLVIVVGGIIVENRVIRRPRHTDSVAPQPYSRVPAGQWSWSWVEFKTYDPQNYMMQENVDGIGITTSDWGFGSAEEARADLQSWLDDMAKVYGGDPDSRLRQAVSEPSGQILLLEPPRGWWVYPVPPERVRDPDSVARDLIRAERNLRLLSLVS
ncbi:hypothetical protein [Nocardia sp. NPDC006630]|uniref:hypothetical protein n=1 Tax=Nocardia sp. NPDC006630 TaxID=3157181 RepID=UPI0033B8951D